MAGDGIIPERLSAAMVRSYIDFDGHAAGGQGTSLQAQLQSEGVAGLWGLLEQQGFAYLGDEVGMGKTRQAMGVIATQFLRKAGSRVVVVCPSRTVQVQWQSEWAQFLRSCYRLLDDRLLATVDAAQIEDLHLHENLRDFKKALRAGESRIHLLRYSSFRRPLPLENSSPAAMLADYARNVGAAHLDGLTMEERALAAQHAKPVDGWQDELGHALGRAYCQRIGAILTDGVRSGTDGGEPVNPLDLVIFDEAQYLRHTGNYQNQHIKAIFSRNVDRWLFLSATPMHSSEHDIRSLDTYLCRRVRSVDARGTATGPRIPDDCSGCTHAGRCSRVAWRLREQGDVVDVLRAIMIRRTRTHGGGDKKRYGKIEYRQYAQVRHSGADDPFLALTMGLVQKRLVESLAGRNNKFRQGECASFESLSSSLGRYNGQEPLAEFEPAKDHKQRKIDDTAPDRNAIDKLNRSFVKAMKLPHGFGLPHAKLNHVAQELFERSLRDGSIEKTLVFVRRIDTVEELRDLLHLKFQNELDDRIQAWKTLLTGPYFGGQATAWDGNLWEQESDEQVMTRDAQASDNDAPPDPGEGPGNAGYRDTASLGYFEALKEHPKGRKRAGILYSFRNQLLRSDDLSSNPLRGFLLKVPHRGAAAENPARWGRLLCALFGQARAAALRDDPSQGWLFADITREDADAYKLASLQRCLLQAIRQTDLLVDLYILHKYVKRTPDGKTMLADKLLWLLENAGSAQVPEKLKRYLENLKEKLLRWITHFDLIVDKCFRGGEAADWATIHDDRVLRAFVRAAPVVGRSGRLHNQYAAQQFMFPTHPNILICTDVLKEGVDMHLFCDKVVHYGVAWTSGDLEQRIGRVDRFGSQISRRIQKHTAESPLPLPRLGVEFPFLDGTLDMYQVKNVIREKIASDLRLDLGKRTGEIRELDASDFSPDSPLYSELVMQGPKDGLVFFPDSVSFARQDSGSPIRVGPGMRYKGVTDMVQPRKQINDKSAETIVPIPGFDALLVRRRVQREHALVRRSFDHELKQILLTEDYLAIRDVQAEAALHVVAGQAAPHSVRELDAAGFSFDQPSNTCALHVALPQVDARASEGEWVLVEALGEQFWVLRGAVQRVEDVVTGRAGIAQWMAERNNGRTIGFLMEKAGIVWCTAVILRSNDAELRLLEQVAPRLARTAANLRSPGVLPGRFGYHASTGFPSIDQKIVWRRSMKTSDVINCGKVLAGIQAWFNEAFMAVFNALYDDEGRPAAGALRIKPLALLPGGLVHLATEGRERFKLQAYFDPIGASANDEKVSRPHIWWELVASPNKQGQLPDLPLSNLEDFPHLDLTGWRGEFLDGSGAFTGTDDSGYRYMAFCHSPTDWDHAKDDLVEAWRAVRNKMRSGGNFQHQWCRDALRAAIGSRIAFKAA